MLENIDRLLVIQDKTVQEVSKTSLGTIFPAQEKSNVLRVSNL